MYTDIKTILDDANKNNYAVLAASAFNMELARGLIAAADEMQAPLIILMGQAQMTKHARPELMVPMIKTLAEQTNVPVALILDHGRDWEKITWAYRQGFSSIMVDASAYDMEENIARTKKAVELCHVQGLAVEGELGHVGQAALWTDATCRCTQSRRKPCDLCRRPGWTAWPLPAALPMGIIPKAIYPPLILML